MKYKSIELYNYAGIYNGMGLTQIKIDFTKCITNKIIIKGKNGSGKSTLLNAINPNPDSNDYFIPNSEARKVTPKKVSILFSITVCNSFSSVTLPLWYSFTLPFILKSFISAIFFVLQL